ncbi:hypothetical protein MIND_00551000 [Mycena indigotica]|uniref:Uncharacterized protein n=1 Tax=Mycena indigotica TaxID=2126181 RepID=A0A8H6W7D1_9AGAR|nr:uncharacterized protein MIND_00551000 [Mycena indigotica]KAF7307562.1 hypothetical protein MIND_00551000 [Mycena indigotica]
MANYRQAGRPVTVYQGNASPNLISAVNEDHFTCPAPEIRNYLLMRSVYPSVTHGGQNFALRDFITECFDRKKSRLHHKGVHHVKSTDVQGAHGLTLNISDIYAALGFVIAETDLFPFSRNQNITDVAVAEVELRVLATYINWGEILHEAYFSGEPSADEEIAPPATACIMYRAGSGPSPIIGSISTSFGGPQGRSKQSAREARVQSWTSAFPTFNAAIPSVRQLHGSNVHTGDCAELPALLGLLRLEPTPPSSQHQQRQAIHIYGVAASTDLASIGLFKAARYNQVAFQQLLKPACDNCKYGIRFLDGVYANGSVDPTPLFQYLDLAPPAPNQSHQPTPYPSVQENNKSRVELRGTAVLDVGKMMLLDTRTTARVTELAPGYHARKFGSQTKKLFKEKTTKVARTAQGLGDDIQPTIALANTRRQTNSASLLTEQPMARIAPVQAEVRCQKRRDWLQDTCSPSLCTYNME